MNYILLILLAIPFPFIFMSDLRNHKNEKKKKKWDLIIAITIYPFFISYLIFLFVSLIKSINPILLLFSILYLSLISFEFILISKKTIKEYKEKLKN